MGAQADERSRCLPGDVLIALKGKNRKSPILGRAAIVDKEVVFSSDLAKVSIKAQIKY
jgi:hypothetical protein